MSKPDLPFYSPDRPMYWIDRGDGARPAGREEAMLWWEEDTNTSGRRVAETMVEGHRVSTVCLGFDHGYFEEEPVLYETMVFPSGPSFDEEYCNRYRTREEAKAGHEKTVAWVAGGMKGDGP